jgi:hypothetical protein
MHPSKQNFSSTSKSSKDFIIVKKKTPLNIGENSEKRFFQEFLQKDE